MQSLEISKRNEKSWKNKIAIYSNDEELSKKVIDKLKQEGYFKEKCLAPQQFTSRGVYIPNLDIMISHLSLEMHYPEYAENLIYGDKYLENN